MLFWAFCASGDSALLLDTWSFPIKKIEKSSGKLQELQEANARLQFKKSRISLYRNCPIDCS
jgi:hypothetical protein